MTVLYRWEAHKHGLVVRAERGLHGCGDYLADLDCLQPYEFHALPYDTRFPASVIMIEGGMEPIWLYAVNHGISSGPHATQRIDSALIFGRSHPVKDGVRREEVILVLADGTVSGFASVEAARAVFHKVVLEAQARGKATLIRSAKAAP